MPMIDLRCTWSRCPEAEKGDAYRMVGSCGNCGTDGILLLYTAGHPKSDSSNPAKCPVCGNRSVRAVRLATEDEIPSPTEEMR